MTDADQSWGTAGGQEPSPRRRTTLVAGAAVAAVALATIGGVSGWVLAGDGEPGGPAGADGTGVTRPAPPPTTRGAATPPAVRTTPPKKSAPAGQLVVPDLVGDDFEGARDELRRRDLGWRLVFLGDGDSRAVESTDPPAGQAVRKGITVTVLVAGAAPPVEVPDVIGDPCAKAASRLVDEGLYPDYPTGRAGEVVQQDPAPDTELRWNDRVRISCGKTPAGKPSTEPPD